MSGRPGGNHAPAFRVKAAPDALKGERTPAELPGLTGSSEPDCGRGESSGASPDDFRRDGKPGTNAVIRRIM
jgi:hypothetical protein